MPHVTGLHHVTAISGPAQANLDFWAGTLGMRLVKKTVNFDDPGTYHLYYGDGAGSPGSIMTFFPWADAPPGRVGTGQVQATALAIPAGSAEAWLGRLADLGVDVDGPAERFGQAVLRLRDVHRLPVELIEDAAIGDTEGWDDGPVEADHAVRRFHSVTLGTFRPDDTARVLTDLLGFEEAGTEGPRTRFRAVHAAPGGAAVVDLVRAPDLPHGRMGTGIVHHVAFRVPDDEAQLAMQDALDAAGLGVTEVKDRNYFRSIYFREPGGVLFEIATDPPGFTADEALDELGMGLKLPSQYERLRPQLEQTLPPLTVPA